MACQPWVIEPKCKAGEGGTFSFQTAFLDEEKTPVIPNNIKWSLYDEAGEIVNAKENVIITPPAEVITITLKGNDLALPDTTKPERRVLVEYDYDSTLGTDLPVKFEYIVIIENLNNVKEG